jgi:hypothetical protein
MFATSTAQALLHAEAAASTPDVVMTDGLEGEIESALAAGWHPPRPRRRARARTRCLRRRRLHPVQDDSIFRP